MSHRLRKLVLPYLYRRVEINVRDRLGVRRFEKAVSQGASTHFHYSRSLTIWDKMGSIEAEFILPPPHERKTPLSFGKQTTSEQRRDLLGTILSHFATARLATFRLVSPEMVLRYPNDNQITMHNATLQHLHYNTNREESIDFLGSNIRTLDLVVHDNLSSQKYKYIFCKVLSSLTPNVERLYLDLDDPHSVASDHQGSLILDNMLLNCSKSLAHLANLRVLSSAS